MEDLISDNPNAVITRGNIAGYLVESGQIKSREEVFKKYLGDDGICYVKRNMISVYNAIQLIHESGGIACLAHPTLYNLKMKELEHIVKELKEYGLDGIEAQYTTYHNEDNANMKYLSTTYNLIPSGGSDYHGKNKPYIHLGTGRGNLYIHNDVYDNLYSYYINH